MQATHGVLHFAFTCTKPKCKVNLNQNNLEKIEQYAKQ